MKPFYERGGIVLYHGDCLEMLPKLPRESVHLLLTDPPYGVGYVRTGRALGDFGPIAGDDTAEAGRLGIDAAVPALKRRRQANVFGPFDLASNPLLESPYELIWDKVMLGPPRTGAFTTSHERIACAQRKVSGGDKAVSGTALARVRRGSVLRYQRPNALGVTRHPTEKPVPLLRELIECATQFGETVLDPFAGSGSTLVAAYLEGRKAIGMELEERYCEVAAKRLDAAMAQGTFDLGGLA